MIATLSSDRPAVEMPPGRYKARVARSYGAAGYCTVAGIRLRVGGHGASAVAYLQHPGGPVSLVAAPGVSPLVEVSAA
jgi:hypothetical protein